MKNPEKSDLEKFIRHEIRRVIINFFLDFRSDMYNSSSEIFDEKYLPKILEEVYKIYPKIDE